MVNLSKVEVSEPGDPESNATPGGFAQAVDLLEFDRVRQALAGHTSTVIGGETALGLTPSADLLEVATRLQETSEACRFLEARLSSSNGSGLEFGPGIDFREFVRRALLGGLLSGQELHAVSNLAAAARYNRRALARHEEMPLLSGIADNLPDLKAIEQAIAAAVGPAGEVLDHASPGLGRLREESRRVQHRLNQVMERNLRRLQRMEVIQEPIVTQRNGRMVLLVKAEMRPQVPGIVHDVSDSGATVFVEPMPAIDMGNRWREVRLAEQREEERVLRVLSDLVSRQGEGLLLTLHLMARLDLAVAKGRYAAATRAFCPAVSQPGPEGRSLKIVRGRHPLLSGDVVPISLELGGAHTVMLVTGPNAGGKTVALKTAGLLAMMAQAGLHVPADEARFPCFDGIYADIGDQQSIEHSLSTFSSHIGNLLTIMECSTANSLLLVDELGASTDPEEGSALAKAILHHFQRQGLLMVATTHHRSVARYVQEQRGMINASVELDPDTLDPTYQVTLGLPGRSYALTIAGRLGLPQDIIDQARQSLSPQDRVVEDLLTEIQQERMTAENLRKEAEAALFEARKQQAQAEDQLASVEGSKVEILEETRRELLDRINGMLARFQQMEKAWDRPESPPSRKEDRAYLEEARREVVSPQWEPIEVQRPAWQERIKKGDRVFIRGIGRPVEVITPPDQQGQVEVLLGTMRSTVPVYDLERPAAGHPAAAQHGVHFQRSGPRERSTEIDLRGLRVEDAVIRIDAALDNAVLDGASSLRIIHGKGTGALRQALREHLEGHPLVASIGPGEGPGGDGVTDVGLK